MTQSKLTIFQHILSFLPLSKFNQFVSKHGTDKGAKGNLHFDSFVAMLFFHLSPVSSLREISAGLSLLETPSDGTAYKVLSPSSLSYANEKRSYTVFEELFFEIYEHYKTLCSSKRSKEIKHLAKRLFSFDSTTIPLCLSHFPWASFRTNKGGLKLHTLLNNDTGMPELIAPTEAKVSDLTAAKANLSGIPGRSIVVLDRAYVDYDWFEEFTKGGLVFITRLKKNAVFDIVPDTEKRGWATDVRWKQQDVRFRKNDEEERPVYRVVEWKDTVAEKRFIFVTNDLTLSAPEIAALYKARWEVELLFKKLKSNLKLKAFVGRSLNAVMTQIWTGLIAILLAEMLKVLAYPQLRLKNVLALLRSTITREDGFGVAKTSSKKGKKRPRRYIQLSLFDWD